MEQHAAPVWERAKAVITKPGYDCCLGFLAVVPAVFYPGTLQPLRTATEPQPGQSKAK